MGHLGGSGAIETATAHAASTAADVDGGVRTSAVAVGDPAGTATEQVIFRLDRRTTIVSYRDGNTLLQTARSAGLRAPSSCEMGSCGTCMARLTVGSVRMINNDALTEEEVAEGWVLTCQSLPTSASVTVIYE